MLAAYPEEMPAQLHLSVLQNPNDPQPLASTLTNPSRDVLTALSQTATFDPSPALAANQTYYLMVEMAVPEGKVNICGPISLSLNSGGQITQQTLDTFEPCTVSVESPYILPFIPQVDGTLGQVVLGHTVNPDASRTAAPKTLSLSFPASRTRAQTHQRPRHPYRGNSTQPTIRAAIRILSSSTNRSW